VTEAGGIASIGLDWKALLFQLANFGILLVLLKLFAYQPILRVLEERKAKINEGLKNAEEIETLRAGLVHEQKKALQKADADAARIIERSEARSQEIVAAAEEKAVKSAEAILKRSQTQLDSAVAEIKQGLKRETLQLVALATEQIIQQKLTGPADEALIAQALEAVEQGEGKVRS